MENYDVLNQNLFLFAHSYNSSSLYVTTLLSAVFVSSRPLSMYACICMYFSNKCRTHWKCSVFCFSFFSFDNKTFEMI